MSNADDSLTDFVDITIALEGAGDAVAEKSLIDALSAVEGIREFSIEHGKVGLEYDPARVNRAEIERLIARAGFRVGDVVSAAASPINDALHEGE